MGIIAVIAVCKLKLNNAVAIAKYWSSTSVAVAIAKDSCK